MFRNLVRTLAVVSVFCACGQLDQESRVSPPPVLDAGTVPDAGSTPTPLPDTFSVQIDPKQSFDEMVAAGKYDWKSGDVTALNFPITETVAADVPLQLIDLGGNMLSGEVKERLDQLGRKPAKIEHLLLFGAKYPEKQREFRIVAVGSSWVHPNGFRYVPYLSADGSGRGLDEQRDDPDIQISEAIRFLAFSK